MVLGKGLDNGTLLSAEEIRAIVEQAADEIRPADKRILVLIPDLTRSGPTDLMFQFIADALAPRARRLDFMVALGTHHALNEQQLAKLTGLSAQERAERYPDVRLLNHSWDDPDALEVIGTFPAEKMAAYTDGLLAEDIPIDINKRAIHDYDLILVCGPVFPHEVVGFSGGNKYLFPGISGAAFLNFFHWLGALLSIPKVIGVKETKVREAIDFATGMVPIERAALCYVVDGDSKGLAALYFGAPEEAWSKAVDVSKRRHIKYVDRPFSRVLARAPRMYDDLWVGGKCMYKLEPILADGAELIIYAPHITEVSHTHGKILREIGYHTRDYFVTQWEKFRQYPWGLLAHSAHVRGIGKMENGVENCRVQVTLATGIPEEVCSQINLGYLDPATVDIDEFRGREAEGVLFVPTAGEVLYRLNDPPAWARV